MDAQDFEIQLRLSALNAARDDEGKGGGVTPVKDILDRAAAYEEFLRNGQGTADHPAAQYRQQT